jgi:Flp pilus assembly protein TadG
MAAWRHGFAASRPDARRARRMREGAVSLVEFALVAPLAMLLLMGLVVLGIVVTDQVELTNAVRDGARAAAVCGSNPTGTTTLPDGSTACSDANLATWLTGIVQGSHGGVATPTVTVYNSAQPRAPLGSSLSGCQKGYTVEVSATYAQPLFVPLVGRFLGTGGSTTRSLTAKADATCEQ